MPIDLGAYELVTQLERSGPRPPERLVQQILRTGAAARGPLLQLALRTELLLEEPPISYAPIHGLRLLGELPGPELVRPLLEAVEALSENYDNPLAYMWGTEAPQIVARAGADVIAPLLELADDPSAATQVRCVAFDTLSYVTIISPEHRAEVIAALRARLGGSDLQLNAGAIIALGNMAASEAYPDVLQLYRSGQVDTAMIPASQARQLLLTPSAKRLACAKHPLWERYDQHSLTNPPQQS